MISAIETYQDCSDRINVQENGQFDYSMFNRFSWLGQLRLLDWLSGDVSGVQPPEPYRTQKNRDWLSNFVVPYSVNVMGGEFQRPSDYYLFQDLYSLSGNVDCEDDDPIVINKIPVTLISNNKFYTRSDTYITSLKPTQSKPIVKQVGKMFVFAPSDIGSVTLEYIRLPLRAYIATVLDPVYNQPIPDVPNCIDFEWDEFARNILVYYIVDAFANRNREQALKQVNLITNKLDREGGGK